MVLFGLVDYHIHTSRCGHARGEIKDYVMTAVQMGFAEIGIADHIPLYWLPPAERDPQLAMADTELAAYVEEILALRKMFPQIGIKLGIEADYVPGREDELRTILQAYPFDYVLGSVHYIDGWGFDNPDLVDGYARYDPDTLYGKYFMLVQNAARSNLFDAIAHPDLIKKFGCRPAADLGGLYHGTACMCAAANIAVEVNTAGLRAPVNEIYPSRTFLRYCRELDVPVILGSDAHAPGQVGAGFYQALELLNEVGYEEIALFEGRKRSKLKITTR
ncbi:MAG: histidinol-phosphatase HisJ family protein [Bacillota bacterium]|uniref:histidinol-phosphatase HisJ family protein n=1 Tax=Desulforudis sp. DRI-14 TaxID=3459793 RepID=UPI00347F3026